MTLRLRRVVTGHDADGKAIVAIDDFSPTNSARPGVTTSVVWTSEGFPIRNDTDADESRRTVGTWHPNGTVFRVIEFAPGNGPRNHRTDSLDYAVVLSGEIDMDLDGSEVHLKAGDVIVQRGTIHCAGTCQAGDGRRQGVERRWIAWRSGKSPRCCGRRARAIKLAQHLAFLTTDRHQAKMVGAHPRHGRGRQFGL